MLAAGSAILVQLWGFGLGVCDARAADGPGPGPVHRTGIPALLVPSGRAVRLPGDGPDGTFVDRLLRDRIRADGLPLPGQPAAVPDAFAIATVLLPAVPPLPQGDGGAVSAPGGPDGAGAPGPDGPETPDVPGSRTAPAAEAAVPGGSTGADPVRAPDRDDRDGPGDAAPAVTAPLSVTPAAVPAADDVAVAVAVPIAAGLLLTGLAMYRHRGLPSGH